MEGIEVSQLANLPDELVLMIVRHLEYNHDRLSLACSCRRLCTVTLPQVYTSITFNKLSTRLLSMLVDNILRHPALARAVRSLTLMNENAEYIDERLENSFEGIAYDPALITPIVNAACRSQNARITFEEDLKSGVDEDPWLALLLPFLPNLKELHVDYFYEFFHQFKMISHRGLRMSRHLNDGRLPFESLIEVSVMNVIPYDNPPETLQFFKLPKLRKFIGDQVIEIDSQLDYDSEEDGRVNSPNVYFDILDIDSTDDDDDDSEVPQDMDPSLGNTTEPQGYSTVTHIHFKRSISDIAFRRHILACARLHSFIYEYYNSSSCDEFDPASVYSCLFEHRETLEELALVQSNDNFVRTPNKYMVPSLSGFTALRRLWLRAPNLLGPNPNFSPRLVDLLPPNLEAFCITDFEATDQRSLAEQLKGVIHAARTRFPHLRQLTVECRCRHCDVVYFGVPNSSMPETGESAYTLHGACREAGIDLTLVDMVFPRSVRTRSVV